MKYCFIHIPKTAGQSIQQALKDQGSLEQNKKLWGHITLQTMVKNGLKDLKRTVSVVRNPYDRVFSVYHWALKRKYVKGLTFEEFVKKHHNTKSCNLYRAGHFFKPQYDWVTSDIGLAEHILRFEHLDSDFKAFCKEVGLKNNLPHKNRNETKPKVKLSSVYTDETRELVAKAYAKDLEFFHYDWPE